MINKPLHKAPVFLQGVGFAYLISQEGGPLNDCWWTLTKRSNHALSASRNHNWTLWLEETYTTAVSPSYKKMLPTVHAQNDLRRRTFPTAKGRPTSSSSGMEQRLGDDDSVSKQQASCEDSRLAKSQTSWMSYSCLMHSISHARVACDMHE